jgi:hypothetical protein
MMSIGSMPMVPPGGSPRDQVVNNLSAQVEAGEISSEDQEAMLEALDTIHAQREATEKPDFSSGPPAKEEVLAKFETMLSDQIDAGTISQEQADHLSEMFEDGGLGNPGHVGPLGQAPGAQSDVQSGAMMEELMKVVLEQLQGSSSYDGNGDRSSSNVSSLLADFKV